MQHATWHSPCDMPRGSRHTTFQLARGTPCRHDATGAPHKPAVQQTPQSATRLAQKPVPGPCIRMQYIDAVHGCSTWTQYMDAVHGCIRRKAKPSRARPSFPTLRPPSTFTPAGMDRIGLSGTAGAHPKGYSSVQYYLQVPPLRSRPPAAGGRTQGRAQSRSRCGGVSRCKCGTSG